MIKKLNATWSANFNDLILILMPFQDKEGIITVFYACHNSINSRYITFVIKWRGEGWKYFSIRRHVSKISEVSTSWKLNYFSSHLIFNCSQQWERFPSGSGCDHFWNKWMRAIHTPYSLWQYHRELMQVESQWHSAANWTASKMLINYVTNLKMNT